jgi:hypothetical protein
MARIKIVDPAQAGTSKELLEAGIDLREGQKLQLQNADRGGLIEVPF